MNRRIIFVALTVLLLIVVAFGCTNVESILVDDGSASAPSISFTSDTDTGFFRSGANTLDMAAAGASQVQLTDGALLPTTDDDVDLGAAGTEFKDAFFDGTVTSDVLSVSGTSTLGVVSQSLSTENVGSLPTIATSTITYTAAAGGSGTVATIADGEIWYVHAVFANVTTNWDATGDDALVEIGDGNDADGLLDLDDAELQAADTEGTGAPAGWQGFMSTDTRGAYLANGHGFIYAPSGAAETIDYNIDETSGETLSAGQLTVYVVYTRLQ